MAADQSIRAVSQSFVERRAELDPDWATFTGVTGHEHRATVHSPDQREERLAHLRHTLWEVDQLEAANRDDAIAIDFHRERIATSLELSDRGEDLRALGTLGSPVQRLRQVFDLLPKDNAEDWEVIAARLAAVPAAVEGLKALLEVGRSQGTMSPRRQALVCVEQCRVWSGGAGETDFFTALVSGADVPAPLSAELTSAASAAAAAYGRLADYIDSYYLDDAPIVDAVGADRYAALAQAYLGTTVDPLETYEWGWEEFRRIEADMAETAERIEAGASIAEVIELLESSDDHCIEGEEDLRRWLQELMDSTIAELDGTHFDIPDPVRTVEAMIAPPGGAAAMYYTGPSEDFTRPGRTWYPTQGRSQFPLWGEVSICYHEGVPGHHLQVGQVTYLGDRLTRFQRLSFVPGHGEGWALYSERLMDELGYLDDPVYRLGYLRAQVLRALRVIVDIGMHLELSIPADSDFAPGLTWNAELGQQFANERSRFPADFMASEVDRYLGLAGQAISYKVGERVWLDGRAEVERRMGQDFDLKAFHGAALDLGHLGLDQLERELAQLG